MLSQCMIYDKQQEKILGFDPDEFWRLSSQPIRLEGASEAFALPKPSMLSGAGTRRCGTYETVALPGGEVFIERKADFAGCRIKQECGEEGCATEPLNLRWTESKKIKTAELFDWKGGGQPESVACVGDYLVILFSRIPGEYGGRGESVGLWHLATGRQEVLRSRVKGNKVCDDVSTTIDNDDVAGPDIEALLGADYKSAPLRSSAGGAVVVGADKGGLAIWPLDKKYGIYDLKTGEPIVAPISPDACSQKPAR
ncbi:MAG TPA: hypothetical protein DCZ01_07485 [Elusimicrobia bacterium]|nr:MAG: hypothetical protein A2X37_06480 [Elusimicrobia bacterium GWA2_66_18]OGR72338.1 MAG: hypothetical protein A2X40_07040 [Elusimicrobia bacterium GWC2_65_9]HAZ08347.1 hypothetical protein [Elusimicrobiota bacterium]